ncbi:EPIDERMAL PATTERNING FACTOR-like protein 4 [Phragmites australis]|uniref:EPIDERMAL PATTERNING FACTOR-like protein 4 n=1 Tax=Phragmites australis TaxID=29695 RepID=UPI002D796491|nr:EPIDERMAL PATTERNING FACTOR-like protein 4 [Phragmites australis]
MPLLMGRLRWRSVRSARRLFAVACGFAAAAAALVVSLCFVCGGGGRASGGVLASDFGRMAGAAAGAHPVDQELAFAGRRLLSAGPGSHPPRCTSKCGSCSPCYPVHVSVPPGVLVTTEYYPEAWRCKCRNQLYMP